MKRISRNLLILITTLSLIKQPLQTAQQPANELGEILKKTIVVAAGIILPRELSNDNNYNSDSIPSNNIDNNEAGEVMESLLIDNAFKQITNIHKIYKESIKHADDRAKEALAKKCREDGETILENIQAVCPTIRHHKLFINLREAIENTTKITPETSLIVQSEKASVDSQNYNGDLFFSEQQEIKKAIQASKQSKLQEYIEAKETQEAIQASKQLQIHKYQQAQKQLQINNTTSQLNNNGNSARSGQEYLDLEFFSHKNQEMQQKSS